MSYFIDIRWYVEDVRAIRPDLDYQQCELVLRVIEHDHDASIGVNWTVLKEFADRIYPTSKEET